MPLRDASCDLVISEYGAAIWADPYRWIPEAARLLRLNGELVFLGKTAMLVVCAPTNPGVEFHLGHGDWIRLFDDPGVIA